MTTTLSPNHTTPDELAPVLGPDSPATQALAAARGTAATDSELRALLNACDSEFARLRDDRPWARSLYPARAGTTLVDRLADHLAERTWVDPKAPAVVFRYMLLTTIPGRNTAPASEDVSTAYFANRHLWDRLLPDLVPPALRFWARRRGYVEDSNPDALGDWDYVTSRRDPGPGIPTGFADLDDLAGGLRGLVVLAGPPASGKSTFVLNIVFSALAAHPELVALGVVSEASKDAWLRKALSRASGIEYSRARLSNPDADVADRLALAGGQVRALLPRLRLVSTVRQSIGIADGDELYRPTDRFLIEEAGALRRRTDARRLLVFIDSLDYTPFYLRGPDGRVRAVASSPTDLEADVRKVRALRDVAQHFNTYGPQTAVLAVTRVSSKGDRAGRLGLGDVRGSSDLVFEPDQVLLIQRDGEAGPGVTQTVVRVAKVRDTGAEGEVVLHHLYATSQFVEPGTAVTPAIPPAGPARAFDL